MIELKHSRSKNFQCFLNQHLYSFYNIYSSSKIVVDNLKNRNFRPFRIIGAIYSHLNDQMDLQRFRIDLIDDEYEYDRDIE